MMNDVSIYGVYINDSDDTPFAGDKLVNELKERNIIKGSNYIEHFSTEFNLPFCRLNNKEFDDVTYEIHSIDNNLLNFYRLIRKGDYPIANPSDFDNRIFIIKDDPDYSFSGNGYITETMIVDSDKPFIINIGYRSELKYYADSLSSKQMKKVLNTNSF